MHASAAVYKTRRPHCKSDIPHIRASRKTPKVKLFYDYICGGILCEKVLMH